MLFYKLSKDAVLETFDDGGLVLILPERRLVELNPSAVEVLKLFDGNRTIDQVAVQFANKYSISMEQANQDVVEFSGVFNKSGLLTLQSEEQEKEGMKNLKGEKLLRNPDVVMREEDPNEGALLFNPDTNQVKVINITGMYIWQQCVIACTLDEIIAEVQKGFDEVPLEQVDQDVQQFIDDMLASGFIGQLKLKDSL